MNKMWKEVEKNACGMELKYLDGKKNLRLTKYDANGNIVEIVEGKWTKIIREDCEMT